MRIKCPSCSQIFAVPDGALTGKGKCPKCGKKLDLGRMLRPGDLQPGTVVGGCRIEGVLGRGGMAAVYVAKQLSLDRTVALKVLPKAFAHDRQFVERFNREASALARLSHPNIVGILDKGVEGETYYFVMECVEGKSLRDRLLREGKLSPQETLELIQGICAALEYAHEHGIIHRDLKPGNILLDASGTPKLADFGIARIVGSDTSPSPQLTSAHMVMGSADYMAPEQRESAAGVDHRADIYALGVMLYQMLTGQVPVGTFKPVSRLVPGVPSAVDRVIRAALAPAPDDRCSSVAKLRSALTQAFSETGTRVGHRAAAQRRSSPVLGVAIAAVAALALGAGALYMLTRRGATPPAEPDQGKAVRPVTRTTATRHVVQPEPSKVVEKAPKHPPEEDTAAVREALADVRQFIASHPDDYDGQIKRLSDLIVRHKGAVADAARKELDAAIGRLNQAIDAHLARIAGLADAFVAKREFGQALKAVADLPANLCTKEAKEKHGQLVEAYRAKAWAAFNGDRKRSAALLAAGKPAEAAQALQGTDYGLPDVKKQVDEELQKIQHAAATLSAKAKAERDQARVKLADGLKSLWAERNYAEALALVKDAQAKAPDAAWRTALQPHLQAAALLDAFWTTVLEGARGRKGGFLTIKDVKYRVVDLDGEALVLALPGVEGSSTRELKKLSPDELSSLARDKLDPKKADDDLALALFHTYDAKPNPALAAKAFERAAALGTPQATVTTLRDISAAVQPETKEPEPKEPEVTGYALDFNGASDYVEVPDDKKKLSIRLKSFTIEAWVWFRPHPDAEHYIVTKNAGWTTSYSFALYVKDGNWAYATGDGIDTDFVVTRVACPPGTWAHVALVCDDVQRVFYVNGQAVDHSRARRHVSYDEQPLYVGARSLDANPSGFWSGAIDEVRLTNGVRYRKDFTPERQCKADSRTHLLFHLDEGKGLRARDASEFKNSGQIRGARFVAPADPKLPEAPAPEPVPPQPPTPPPAKQPPVPPKK